MLDQDPEDRTEKDKNTAISLGVEDPNDNQSLPEAIEKSRQSKSNASSRIKDAEVTIAAVMLEQGNPFATFCVTQVFGEQSEHGFISTMIKARKELRDLDHRSEKSEIRIQHLQTCRNMLEGELTEEQRTEAIKFCASEST